MTRCASPEITVVVCSYNGAEKLGRCLEALERQSARERAQLVVVDDGSTDATSDVARAFDVELAVHERNAGISRARNTGIELARAPIVAFTDDDCIPNEDWLAELLRAHERPHVIAAGGSVEVAHVVTSVHRYLAEHNPLAPLELDLEASSSLLYRLVLYVERMWLAESRAGDRAVYSFAGANMSFKKFALEAVGMFDERMTFGADDEYICGRVRKQFPSSLLWFDPKAVVRHDYVGSLADLARRNYAYGRGHARSYLLGPDRGWPIIFPLPLAALASVTVMRRTRRLLLVPIALQLLLPQGIRAALRHRRADNLVFSYLRLAEEAAHDAGMLAGLIDPKAWQARRQCSR
ncbi:MAG: hypothetical protein JWO62_3128 [Acidimicrobiaceae bacterium]|nr:hypothetical protein [Acidimicrobiaceae bacterium]